MNPFLLHSTGTGCTLSDLNSEADVEIPPPWTEPAASSALSSSVSVAFDLETTGLGPLSSMTQISAAACGTDKAFSCYILPDQPISQQSTDVTGIGTCRRSGQTVLTVHGKPVASSTLREGMKLFLDFLSQFSKVLLVAHNGKAFDMKVLIHQARHCGLEAELVGAVAGFADTLLAFRHHLKGKIPKFTLGALNAHFNGPEFAAHDAAGDVSALQHIITKLPACELAHYQWTTADCVAMTDHHSRKKVLANGIRASGLKALLSAAMIDKIALSGLGYQHLKLAFTRDGTTGISGLFQEKVAHKPRVTSNRKVIAAVQGHFSSLAA